MQTPRFWQSRGAASTLLQPLAALYGIGARYDRTRTPAERVPVPVISIGNATAGGAGKTPTALALAPMLQAMGHRPHIVTRGYGGSATAPVRITPESDWRITGDEPQLLARLAPTWVARDRVAAARLAHQHGADVILADDAHQHYKLHKDIALLVVDGHYGFGNGRLLPAGPLREPLAEALARTDAIVLIGENRHGLAFDCPVFTAQLQPEEDLSPLHGQRLLAFAGLGLPEKFYRFLRASGLEVVATQNFPDHHPYSPRELDALLDAAARANAIAVTTAKDAVKLPPAYRDRIRTIDIALRFDDAPALQAWLQTRLASPI